MITQSPQNNAEVGMRGEAVECGGIERCWRWCGGAASSTVLESRNNTHRIRRREDRARQQKQLPQLTFSRVDLTASASSWHLAHTQCLRVREGGDGSGMGLRWRDWVHADECECECQRSVDISSDIHGDGVGMHKREKENEGENEGREQLKKSVKRLGTVFVVERLEDILFLTETRILMERGDPYLPLNRETPSIASSAQIWVGNWTSTLFKHECIQASRPQAVKHCF
ncbi:hypothetical protein B0H16DRAFT_1467285 [Mycena metata]|uniref:Uncharacterized protein n=1 Tax=Mycena metata TaxID=1033252 RepID=A0AAD7MWD7_9AGAR|nr:hypothetical protein B0H16DRAFT_1467285 [Mycena metata]